ncbi:hypothetical protein [Ktedonospora formicarum]|uniref:hypothetical protein n=1 Tax=Ktedonospora formicarum TaxID=2778364 RepID=UPI001F3C8A62|nr:hypothetical protein [Ktedonospora formicarum]
MAVCRVDGGQALAVRFDPRSQSVRLRDSEQGVNQHGVPFPTDERRRGRRPEPLLFAWRRVEVCKREAWRDKHLPVKLTAARFALSHRSVSFQSSDSLCSWIGSRHTAAHGGVCASAARPEQVVSSNYRSARNAVLSI